MFAGANDNPMQNFKKILEINPHHKVNQIILEKINVSIINIHRTIRQTSKYNSLLSFFSRLLHSIQDSVLKIPIPLLKDFTKYTQKLWVL